MRLIFWFLVAANLGMLTLRYGVGIPLMFQEPKPALHSHNKSLDAVPKITLLSEVGTLAVKKGDIEIKPSLANQVATQVQVQVQDEAPKETSIETSIETVDQCKSVGPFEADSIAEGFVARLAALDVVAKVQQRKISAGTGYWLYLEPLDNRKKVRQKLLDLQARGIDCYIIPKGNLENGISLGMFSQLSLANNKILDLKKMGYEAKVQKIERSYDEPWVVIMRGEEQKIGAAAWKMLLKGKNNLKEQQNVCLDVDSQ